MSKSELIWVTKELVPMDGGSDVASSFQPSDEHLAIINKYTLDSVAKEDIAAFPVRAMNDSIDRDMDQFTLDCVNSLAINKKETGPLGKPFLFSHSRMDMAKGRIYLADTEKARGVTHLKLWVYIPNTAQYQSFIENLVYGVYWAVSVGVSTDKTACSACGVAWPDHWSMQCENGHQKGAKVDGKKVYRQIGAIPEFFELSSVFLGAQYGAEVVKKVANKDIGDSTVSVIRKAIQEVNEEDTEEFEEEPEIETKPYPNEHACRINPPGDFVKFRRENGARKHNGKSYDVIWGITADGTTKEQAYRYSKSIWDAKSARAHCKNHKGSFAAATGKEMDIAKANWEDLSLACSFCLMSGDMEMRLELEERCAVLGKIPPWENQKVVTLVEEGAELESMDDGSLKISKGTKFWLYDGTKIVRGEVKQVKDEIERLTKELEIKTEEFDAIDVKLKEAQDAHIEAKELNAQLTKELEDIKSELESKSKIVDSYLDGLKSEVVKWYKLSKGESADNEVDASFAVRLLDKCGDDPELLKELEEDFKDRAKAVMPPEVRRSSMEDSTGIEEKEAESEEDDDEVANSIHS